MIISNLNENLNKIIVENGVNQLIQSYLRLRQNR